MVVVFKAILGALKGIRGIRGTRGHEMGIKCVKKAF